MRAGDVRIKPSMLAEVVGGLECGGAGRPEEIAHRLGADWTEDDVPAALAGLFSYGVAWDKDEIGSGGSHDRH